MSSPLGFTPWRRRTLSSSSQHDQPQSLTGGAVSSSNSSHESQHPIASARPPFISSAPCHWEPIRSSIHGSVRESLLPVDKEQNTRSVREETAELASYLLSDGQAQPSPAFLQRARSSHHQGVGPDASDDASTGEHASNTAAIFEVPEPPLPDAQDPESEAPAGPSVRANLLKGSPPQSIGQDHPHGSDSAEVGGDGQTRVGQQQDIHHTDAASEQTPLLSRVASGGRRSYTGDLEGQQMSQTKRPWIRSLVEAGQKMEERMTHGVALAVNRRLWDRKALWHVAVVTPVSCLPAVAVGLLLNILDALSYGMIRLLNKQSVINQY